MMMVIVDAMVTHDDGDSGRDGDSLSEIYIYLPKH